MEHLKIPAHGISIHALLAESDFSCFWCIFYLYISIHALLAESDWDLMGGSSCNGNFYPRSPCGERPPRGGFCYLDNIISIHALLAESDKKLTSLNPHHPAFLSTLSLRRATYPKGYRWQNQRHFYPRSPCGERRTTTITICIALKFLSTLSLRRATSKL